MCGFIGQLSFEKVDIENLENVNNHIICRGPDNRTVFTKEYENYQLNLIFNRLAIVDLSEGANQPMFSKNKNTILLFNGEIYNHRELRVELESKGVKFTTSHSDSETVLNGLDYFGIEFVKKLRGQFAIVYIDNNDKKMYFIRDRLGQKPLFYHISHNCVSFSSNLKSLLENEKNYTLSTDQINNYINYGIINSPKTLFDNFYKVKPAEIIEINFKNRLIKNSSHIYWNIEDYVDNNKFNEDSFHQIFTDSVSLRSNADVPVASFLSGGIDSTSIIKNQFENDLDVNSFSVYIGNQKYDERQYIKQVVDKYSLNHTSIELTEDISIDDIFKALSILDEPYSDPSVVPSFLLSREISKNYKVAISGDGGDELLGGYTRTYKTMNDDYLNPSVANFLFRLFPGFIGTGGELMSKSKNLEDSYRSLLEDSKLLNLLKIKSEQYQFMDHLKESNNIYKSLLISDYRFYLPEMMMYKIDRTSMASSVEVRSPFVDHKIIEYVISHDTNYFDKQISKKVLKNYLKSDFSDEFINRSKQGFIFNVEDWVYGNLSLIEDIFKSGTVVNNLNPNILKILSINKSRINGQRIWKLFVLENYLNFNFTKSS